MHIFKKSYLTKYKQVRYYQVISFFVLYILKAYHHLSYIVQRVFENFLIALELDVQVGKHEQKASLKANLTETDFKLHNINLWYKQFCIVTFFSVKYLFYQRGEFSPRSKVVNKGNLYVNQKFQITMPRRESFTLFFNIIFYFSVFLGEPQRIHFFILKSTLM